MKASFSSRHSNSYQLSPQEIQAINADICQSFRTKYTTATKKKSLRLSTHELLAISEDINVRYQTKVDHSQKESKIVLLPVDPRNVHIYWHIGPWAFMQDDSPLILRVNSETCADPSNHYFDIELNMRQKQHTVTLPDNVSHQQIKASLGQYDDQKKKFNFIISSTKMSLSEAPIYTENQQALFSISDFSATAFQPVSESDI